MLINEFERIPDNSLLVFLHITKTGGVSFDKVLRKAYGDEYFRESQSNNTYLTDLDKSHKNKLRAISGHFKYGVHAYFSALPLYVTCVRNPVERIVSLYNHIHRKTNHYYHNESVKLGINDFCMSLADGVFSRHYSQCEIICGKNDFLLAKNFLKTFYVYCELSQLDDMQQLLFSNITGKKIDSVKRENINPFKDSGIHSNKLDETTEKYLLEKYSEDMLLVEYVSEKFNASFQPARMKTI